MEISVGKVVQCLIVVMVFFNSKINGTDEKDTFCRSCFFVCRLRLLFAWQLRPWQAFSSSWRGEGWRWQGASGDKVSSFKHKAPAELLGALCLNDGNNRGRECRIIIRIWCCAKIFPILWPGFSGCFAWKFVMAESRLNRRSRRFYRWRLLYSGYQAEGSGFPPALLSLLEHPPSVE